jgi:hypothetical protein
MAKAAKKETAKKAATKKSASEIRKEHIAHVTHKPAPEAPEVETPAVATDAPQEPSHAKAGRKPRVRTTDERLDRLEALHAALVVKLRPHGIHLESHDEQEVATTE